MRGKGCGQSRIIRMPGITPAYAGKRDNMSTAFTVLKDHPRLCGEKLPPCCAVVISTGSPPPMRGKVDIQSLDEHGTRITPAYAGKRSKKYGRCTPV